MRLFLLLGLLTCGCAAPAPVILANPGAIKGVVASPEGSLYAWSDGTLIRSDDRGDHWKILIPVQTTATATMK